MNDDKIAFSCPNCGTRLKGPATAQKVRCSQCKKIVNHKLLAIDESLTPSLAKAAIPRAVKPPELPESLSFLSYCWRSYTETHTSLPWLFGMILGGILIAALSFSKPSLGTQFILGSFLLMALIAFLSFAVLSSIACVNYLFRKQRHVPDDRTTWLSATACFSLTLSLALAICSVAEFFGPSKGILVTLVPQLEKEQARFFQGTTLEHPETESLASNSGDYDVTDSVAEDSSDSTDVEASELLESEPVRASESASTREMSADSDNEPSPKRNTPDSSPVVARVVDEAERTSQSDRSQSSKPVDSNSTEKTQEVIAEGVGATSDEAIKDAYRNAVRLVVGAVVDAETLVKNDEVIDDKVLTYSDGFITSYEEVLGSKKVKGGLHRIKIKAQVERRSVIAKLKAANVTVKEVDGKGLFAEAVTQLDAEKDAAALLKKQFEGFPQSCITATIIGKPDIVTKTDEKVTVEITVQIEPDLKAYKAFADKLIPILDKLAKDKGEFTAKFIGESGNAAAQDELYPVDESGRRNYHSEIEEDWMSKASKGPRRGKERPVTLAVAMSRTNLADSIDYRYFVLDASVAPLLKAIAARSSVSCKLQLLNANGESVITDRFKDLEHWRDNRSDDVPYVASPIFINESIDYFSNMILSPVFLVKDSGGYLHQKKTLKFARSLTLSLDELKSVKDAKVEITFDE